MKSRRIKYSSNQEHDEWRTLYSYVKKIGFSILGGLAIFAFLYVQSVEIGFKTSMTGEDSSKFDHNIASASISSAVLDDKKYREKQNLRSIESNDRAEMKSRFLHGKTNVDQSKWQEENLDKEQTDTHYLSSFGYENLSLYEQKQTVDENININITAVREKLIKYLLEKKDGVYFDNP